MCDDQEKELISEATTGTAREKSQAGLPPPETGVSTAESGGGVSSTDDEGGISSGGGIGS